MDIQSMIVILVIAGAIAFAGIGLARRSRSFRVKPGCEADCGCSSSTKNTVH